MARKLMAFTLKALPLRTCILDHGNQPLHGTRKTWTYIALIIYIMEQRKHGTEFRHNMDTNLKN